MPRRRQFKEFEVGVDMALLEETRKLSRPESSSQVIMSYIDIIVLLYAGCHCLIIMLCAWHFIFSLKYRSTWEFADGTRAANKIWRLKRTLCVCRVWAVGSWSVPDVLGSRGVRRHQQQTTRGREQQGQACPIF